MKSIKYFIEYVFVKIFYFIFRILGFEVSSLITGKIFRIYGFFSKRTSIAINNLGQVIKGISNEERKKLFLKCGKTLEESSVNTQT